MTEFIESLPPLLGIIISGLIFGIPNIILIILCFLLRERRLGIVAAGILLLGIFIITPLYSLIWEPHHALKEFALAVVWFAPQLIAFIVSLVGVALGIGKRFEKK